MAWLQIIKTEQFHLDLDDIVWRIAQDNPDAALAIDALIHSQVDKLTDPNFPRRRGRLAGTMELVAHPNYIVLLKQTPTKVTALSIMHVARQYP